MRPTNTARVKTAAPVGEAGYVTAASDGWINWDPFEKVPSLQWPQCVSAFLEMDNDDSRVSSLLEAISLPIRSTAWRIDPNGAPPEVVQFVSRNLGVPVVGEDTVDNAGRSRGRFSWSEHLRLIAAPVPQFGHCVDYETEVLTQRGWITGHELRVGDQVMTLNPETGLGEWQPCEAVHRWAGAHEVRRLEGRSHSSVTTLNHKWITRDYDSKRLRFRTTAKLNTNDRIIRAAPTANLPAEPKWSDAFVELVAWYYTEGQELPGGGVAIWQSQAVNRAHCQRIRAAMTAMFGPAQQSLRHRRGGWREETRIGGVSRKPVTYWYVSRPSAEELRRVAPRKVVAGEFIAELTAAQLRLFVETSIDADGCRSRGAAQLAQKDPQRLDAFEMACSLLGIPWTRSTARNHNPCTRTGEQLEVRPVANARRTVRGRNTTDTLGVVEGVWCPQVPNRTWLARRRGTVYFTGNSVFEQVYRRDGDRLVLRKLGPRPQWTIQNFNVAPDGGLDSITQLAPASPRREPAGIQRLGASPTWSDISINRLVVYTRNMRPGHWYGRSILRPSYKHWLLKNELMRIEVAVARRNGMGVPVGTASRPDDPAEVEAMRKIAAGFRGGLHSGVGLAQGQTLALLGVQGNLPDIRLAIDYHDKGIALGGLAHFLNLDKGGSFALAQVQERPFVQALNTAAGDYRDTAQQHVVEDLVDVNFGTEVRVPLLVFEKIGSHQDATAQALKLLVDAGLLAPDLRIERALRQALDLPAKPDEDDPDAEPPAGKPEPAAPAPPQTSAPPEEDDSDQE